MKFSYKWLQDYVDCSLSVDELAEKLSSAGLEVEGIEHIGQTLSHVVTGKIERISPHPNADRLVVCELYDGTNTHQIVTGAKNISEGDIVPMALPGAELHSGLQIKSSELRGVPSHGMLCSESELGVAEEAAGIWILPTDTPLGVDFIDYASLKDSILDIAILPNRGDCQSMVGLAREVAVLCGTDLKLPDTSLDTSNGSPDIRIQCDTPDLCPLYTARLLTHVQSDAVTPLWMQRRLHVSGIRSINVSVDITNYVLLEMGQPLHAFDRSLITSDTIRISQAKADSKLTTLDGNEQALLDSDLVISDNKTPIALAGVMGGQSTEVSMKTDTILLEAAYFHPATIRRTAFRLALRSDSSMRFEKGVDIHGVLQASDRAAHLYQQLAGATVLETPVQFSNTDHPLFSDFSVPYDPQQLNDYLGTTFKNEDIEGLLSTLGFSIKADKAVVPSWRRHDIHAWPCLTEEIIRVKGFAAIPETPLTTLVRQPLRDNALQTKRSIRNRFVSLGFHQTNTFPMVSPTDCDTLKHQNVVKIANPLSQEESIMRPELMISLLNVTSHNVHRQHDQLKLFEMDKTFHLDGDEIIEEEHVSGIITEALSFPQVKGLLTQAIPTFSLGYKTPSKENIPTYLHPKGCVAIYSHKKHVGWVGLIHPLTAKQFGVPDSAYCFDLSLTQLLEHPVKPPIFADFSKFPSTRRDIALLVPKTLPYADIETEIKKYLPQLVDRYFLFDLFESESIGEDNKSIAIAFIYQDAKKTLSDDKVNRVHEAFSQKLITSLPASIR